MANDQVKVTITAEDATQNAFRSVTASLRGLQSDAASALAGLGALGAGLSVAGLVSKVLTTVDSMDALNDASDRTGSSVEELSSLLNTLSPYGASLDQITDATSKLARAMAGADEETKGSGAAFAALGIATRDAAGNLRPTVAVLDDVAKALAQYEDGTNKTVIVQALFGKAGSSLLPLLKDLANAQRAAASVTTKQAEAAEKLNVELGKIRVASEAAAVSIASEFIPDLARLAEQFRITAQAGGSFYESLRAALGPNKFVEQLEADLRGLEAQRPITERLLSKEAVADLDKRIAEVRRKLELLRPAQRVSGGVQDQFDGVTPGGAPPKRGQAPKLPAQLSDEAKRAAEAYAELDRVIRQADIDDELKRQAAAAKAAADAFKAYNDLLGQIAGNERLGAEQALSPDASGWQKVADVLREIRSIDPQTKARNAALDVANQLLEAGSISFEEYEQLGSKIFGLVDPLTSATQQASDAARELGLTFTSAFEDAIVGGRKLSSVLEGLVADVARVLTRQQLTGPILDMISGTYDPKKSGSTIAGMLYAAFGGARAAGGPVSAGSAYLVGERGPELFVPKTAGTIVPNARQANTVSVVQNIVVGSGVNRNDVAQAMLAAKESAKAEILQSMRRGGAYSVA